MEPLPVKKSSEGVVPLNPVEMELIRYFVRAAQALSLPRSIGEIFGLLFCTAQPMAFDTIVARLGISKGTASQGLRVLQKLGAARTLNFPRDRRTFFEAETSLRKLLGAIIEENVRPHMIAGEQHLRMIDRLLEQQEAQLKDAADGAGASGADAEEIRRRIDKLKHWHEQANSLLPSIGRLTRLEGPGDC